MSRFISRFKIFGFLFFLLSAGVVFCTDRSYGYIMPAEQLIRFMAAKFSKFETVIIKQSAMIENNGGGDAVSKDEEVWIRSPNFMYYQLIDQERKESDRESDMGDQLFRLLLISNSNKNLMKLLIRIGVDLSTMAYTRIDGTIAYQIGGEDQGAAKILIEKERFLPLLLRYKGTGKEPNEMIEVRFKDYRKLDQGWYPFEIDYSSGGVLIKRYRIQSIDVNTPLDITRLKPLEVKQVPLYKSIAKPSDKVLDKQLDKQLESRDKAADQSGEDRLRRIIRAFEKKYQRGR